MTAKASATRKALSTLGAPVTLASIALLVAGCGGSSSPGVAHLSTAQDPSSTGSEGAASSTEGGRPSQQQLVTFAKCMRANGVPEFPEPSEGHLAFKGPKGIGGELRRSGQIRSALQKCRKLLPNGGVPSPQVRKQLEEHALKFSACMRSHGVPNFPTPTFEGGGARFGIHPSSGLDKSSPQFQAALKSYRQYFGPPGANAGPGG
jgi:hypothetical protein